MKSVLIVFAILMLLGLIGMLILFGIGLGAGYFVHWLFPAVDLGAAVVAGVVAASVTSYFLFQFVLAIFGPIPGSQILTGESGEDDSDNGDFYVLPPLGPTRTRRRKSTRHNRLPPASP